MTITVALKGDYGREAVLSDQLLRRSEVPRLVANDALLARHQHVKEVVNHNRDLDAINGNEHETIVRLRQDSPSTQRKASRRSRSLSRGAEAGEVARETTAPERE